MRASNRPEALFIHTLHLPDAPLLVKLVIACRTPDNSGVSPERY
jgi:hypothetical protein